MDSIKHEKKYRCFTKTMFFGQNMPLAIKITFFQNVPKTCSAKVQSTLDVRLENCHLVDSRCAHRELMEKNKRWQISLEASKGLNLVL